MGKRASILFKKSLSKEERDELRAFAESVACDVLEGRGFTCLITGDDQMQALNRDFLKHDYATDVLSFPAPDGADLGEMAISIDRAREQATAHGHAAIAEVKILMLHGALHLAGHDHETDKGKMRRLESKWRKTLGLPTGLIERARR